MNWFTIQRSWSAFRGRLKAPWGRLANNSRSKARGRRRQYLCKRCGISGDEANRRMRDWIKDPGVLDDWNDTRSILDM